MRLICFILLAATLAPVAPLRAAETDYLAVVRAYADTIITQGRDRYGRQQSPLFAVALKSKDEGYELLNSVPGLPGIRNTDRVPSGANPMHDQNLYQVMYALTEITGEERYADEADQAIRWFFEHCQNNQTKLMAWGEHLGWDFLSDSPADSRAGIAKTELAIHEYYRPWVLWERTFQLAPGLAAAFAKGVWEHQIYDHQTGNFSRHTAFRFHQPATGSEYPHHGGFYIATWAAAYKATGDESFLQAIEVLTDSFNERRNATSDAIPCETITPEQVWPQSNLSLAIDWHQAAQSVPEPLATKLRDSAARTDTVFLKIGLDLSPVKHGFITKAISDTLKPGAIRNGRPRPGKPLFSATWSRGYGESTDAKIALHCKLRYDQVKHDRYKQLVIATADRYLEASFTSDEVIFPGAVAEAITVLLAGHELTGDKKYLNAADQVGQQAVQIYFDKPLPRASTKHDHYEAMTGADTLAMTLLKLWAASNQPQAKLNLTWCDR